MRRRTLLASASASLLAAPAIAQPARTATLKFIPQSNLVSLDPIWTTATITGNHGYYVYDTLYSADKTRCVLRPQMAAGHEVSADGRVWRITAARGPAFPRRHAGAARSTAPPASDRFTQARRVRQAPGPRGRSGGLAVRRPDDRAAAEPTPLSRWCWTRWPSPTPASRSSCRSASHRTDADDGNHRGDRLRPLPLPARMSSIPAAAWPTPSSPATCRGRSRPDWASGGKVAYYDRASSGNIIPDAATAAAALRNGEIDWWENPDRRPDPDA